jgi:hypothetical protein
MLPYRALVRAVASLPPGWAVAIFTERLTLNVANFVEVIDRRNRISQRLP